MKNSYHVRLEKCAFEVHVVVAEGLVDCGQDLLCHLLGAVQVVFTWKQNCEIWTLDNQGSSKFCYIMLRVS